MKEEKSRPLTEEELDVGIRIYGERITDIERSLERNIEYPSEKEEYELKIASLKNKNGVFFSLYKKYLEYRLKISINRPPKRLNKKNRKLLEEKLEKYKKRVVSFYTTKSIRDYEIK